MTGTVPLVGRLPELRVIGSAMSGSERNGVVVAGAAGVGKTRLVREALADLDPRRFYLAQAVASSASSAIPFGALAHLLPTETAGAGPMNLLGWAREAILGAVEDGQRLMLSVDDAHLLDDASAAVVLHLVRTSDAFVLVTVRTGDPEPDAVQTLWKDQLLDRVELAPLTLEDAAEVIRTTLGGDVETATVHRLWQVTEGNPLYLRETVLAGRSAGRFSQRHGLFRWTGDVAMAQRLAELIGARIGDLDEAETSALEFVAFGEPISESILTDLSSPSAVDAVEARQLITIEPDGQDSQARLAHPLYGEAVRAACPKQRSRRRMRELAKAVEATGSRRHDDILRLAVWRLDTDTAHDPEQMLAACRIAWVSSDLPLATRLGWAAVNTGGSVDAATTLATILNYREQFAEAEAVLTAAADTVTSDTDRAKLAAARAFTVAYGQGGVDDAVRMLDEVGKSVREPVPCLTLATMRAEILLTAGRGTEELQVLEAVLRDTRVSAPIQAQALSMSAFGHGHAGRRTEALAHLDRGRGMINLWRHAAPLEEPRTCQARHFVHLFAGELDAAEAAVSGPHTLASQEWHWDFALGTLGVTLGQIARLRSRVAESRRRCREAAVALRGDARTFGPMCFGELAHAEALAGDSESSRESLAEAERQRSPGFALFNYWIDIARPWVLASGGDVAAAVEYALETTSKAHDAGLVGFEVIAGHDAVRLGAANRVMTQLQAAAAQAEGPFPPLCVDHAVAAVSGDGEGLLSVADGFATLGMTLHAAEAAAQAATVYQASGRAERSRTAAAKAWSLAQRCEGARTPALTELRAPGLTRNEWKVAHLASGGLTSKEIADRLAKSVRTVDNQLGTAYHKLGVDNRDDLAGLLGDPLSEDIRLHGGN